MEKVRSYLSQTEPLPSYVLMPATKQPNIRPQKRNVDLRKGLPKNWRKTLMKMTPARQVCSMARG